MISTCGNSIIPYPHNKVQTLLCQSNLLIIIFHSSFSVFVKKQYESVTAAQAIKLAVCFFISQLKDYNTFPPHVNLSLEEKFGVCAILKSDPLASRAQVEHREK